jgi:hypothetical protein
MELPVGHTLRDMLSKCYRKMKLVLLWILVGVTQLEYLGALWKWVHVFTGFLCALLS